MKISFLVTYYNQKDCISRSLQSILEQDIKFPYEVLVGDDGSTDGTVYVIEEYIKLFPGIVCLYTMPREQGTRYDPIERASSNRLNLLRHSRGDYVCFLDGDDYYCSHSFASRAVGLLDCNNDLVGCAFGFKIVYPDGKAVDARTGVKGGIIRSKAYLCNNYIHAGAILFRNVLSWSNIDILEKSLTFDDNIITIYMLNYGSLYFIDEPAYAYVQKDGGIWNSASGMEKDILNAMDFDILTGLIPRYRKDIMVRQFPAVRALFSNRMNLSKNINTDTYLKYVNKSQRTSNRTVLTLLSWGNTVCIEKLWFLFLYLEMYIRFSIFRVKNRLRALNVKYNSVFLW